MKFKLLLVPAIFLGVPLLGWGFDDVAGFLRDPARAAYLAMVGAIPVVATIWFPESVRDSSAGTKPVRRQRWAVVWLQAVGIALAIGGPYCDRRGLAVLGDVAPLRYTGLVLATFGIVLMLWARAALGRQFSLQVTIQPEHQLVTSGLYRHVRHPRYAGILLFLFGTALLYRSWAGLVPATLTVGVLLWRIRDEEALMQREFGAEWEVYRRQTRRLIPFLF